MAAGPALNSVVLVAPASGLPELDPSFVVVVVVVVVLLHLSGNNVEGCCFC